MHYNANPDQVDHGTHTVPSPSQTPHQLHTPPPAYIIQHLPPFEPPPPANTPPPLNNYHHLLKSSSPMPKSLSPMPMYPPPPSPEGSSHLQEAGLLLIEGQSVQVMNEQCPLQVADGHVTDVATWITAHTCHPLGGENQSRSGWQLLDGRQEGGGGEGEWLAATRWEAVGGRGRGGEVVGSYWMGGRREGEGRGSGWQLLDGRQ